MHQFIFRTGSLILWPEQAFAFSIILIYLITAHSDVPGQTADHDEGTRSTSQSPDNTSLIKPGDRLGISFNSSHLAAGVSYRVKPGDELFLDFHYSYEPPAGQIYFEDHKNKLAFISRAWLSRKYVVQPDSTLLLHRIAKPVNVRNKTQSEIADQVSSAYKEAGLLSHPEVNVSLIKGSGKQGADLAALLPEGGLPVPGDGHLQLPVTGRIRVAGLSVEKLSMLLTKKFRERGYPDITITTWFTDISPRFVGVVGAVNMPGLISIQEGMRLWDAVSAAGGFVPNAVISDVRLNRSADGQPAISYSFDRFMQSGDAGQNPVMHDKDLVYVIHGSNP
jgi:protein involved in polysaccharide export with SLBB domain